MNSTQSCLHTVRSSCAVVNSNLTFLFSNFDTDKPENIRLVTTASANNKACLNDVVNFTCSADAFPQVTYQLIVNEMPKENSSTGLWSKTLSSSGTFTYKCVAYNIVGSATSASVNITVNGKNYFFLQHLQQTVLFQFMIYSSKLHFLHCNIPVNMIELSPAKQCRRLLFCSLVVFHLQMSI